MTAKPSGQYPFFSASPDWTDDERARFLRSVHQTPTCWLWTREVDKRTGYAYTRLRRRRIEAHRAAYLLFVGPIPSGLEIDHVKRRGCTHRHCVNPAHLEPVTHAENLRRRRTDRAPHPTLRARVQRCKHGHEYTAENTYWHPTRAQRKCRECARLGNAARREATRG